jgi:hypothetical protein
LSEVRERLAAALLEERRRKAVARYVDEVSAKSEIHFGAAAAAAKHE